MRKWVYHQRSGLMLHVTPENEEGERFLGGYAGCKDGKNCPEMQHVPNRGPIPRGVYRIGDPYDSPDHGPFCLRLTPDSANEMCGRSGFLVHGDSMRDPGSASEGCIIQARKVRELIHASGDRMLEVVE